MFTIKVSTPSEGYRVIPTHGEVLVIRDRDQEYKGRVKDIEEHWLSLQGEGKPLEYPTAILDFAEPGTEHGRVIYLYDDDRAWIMNANGKTVASV